MLVDDVDRLREFVSISTRITHTHPDAEAGAIAVALAAGYAMRGVVDPATFLAKVRPHIIGSGLLERLDSAVQLAERRVSMQIYLQEMGLPPRGVSGYINHTVPAAIFCWLRWPGDFRTAVEEIVLAGGDTDSTGAIVGALVGASVGVQNIPVDWREGVIDFPRTSKWLTRLSDRLANMPADGPLPLCWPLLPARNALFLTIVLLHGVRRLLPPY